MCAREESGANPMADRPTIHTPATGHVEAQGRSPARTGHQDDGHQDDGHAQQRAACRDFWGHFLYRGLSCKVCGPTPRAAVMPGHQMPQRCPPGTGDPHVRMLAPRRPPQRAAPRGALQSHNGRPLGDPGIPVPGGDGFCRGGRVRGRVARGAAGAGAVHTRAPSCGLTQPHLYPAPVTTRRGSAMLRRAGGAPPVHASGVLQCLGTLDDGSNPCSMCVSPGDPSQHG